MALKKANPPANRPGIETSLAGRLEQLLEPAPVTGAAGDSESVKGDKVAVGPPVAAIIRQLARVVVATQRGKHPNANAPEASCHQTAPFRLIRWTARGVYRP